MDTQEARIYIAVLITVIVLGVIIGYFAVSVIRQQRKNSELQKLNAFAEITAMENERARIAADLHDDLGPILSVVKFRVDHADALNDEQANELKTASFQLDEIIARLRIVSNDLMPTVLQRKGLIPALEEFIDQARQVNTTQIIFERPECLNIPTEKMVHIYRILQESVHNCLKHANASRLEILFSVMPGLLRIRCRDNGSGFDKAAEPVQRSGIGMHSLQNRTAILDGSFTIESVQGKGTILIFEIPL